MKKARLPALITPKTKESLGWLRAWWSLMSSKLANSATKSLTSSMTSLRLQLRQVLCLAWLSKRSRSQLRLGAKIFWLERSASRAIPSLLLYKARRQGDHYTTKNRSADHNWSNKRQPSWWSSDKNDKWICSQASRRTRVARRCQEGVLSQSQQIYVDSHWGKRANERQDSTLHSRWTYHWLWGRCQR